MSATAPSQVVDGLYLGNIRDAENKGSLSQNGVTHILSVYNNAKPMLEDKTYLCINAADASSQNLSQYFKECIGFIHECRLNGVSRSTTMVVAYLMTVTPYSWEECLAAVKAVRSFVGPNCGFQQQLQEYQMTNVSEYRVWLRDSFRPSPFKDEEQVGALLLHFTEQQRQEGQRRAALDQRWMKDDVAVCALPNDPNDPSSDKS
ncbi:Dual specificity protein phosphatase 22-A [Merluccius polli]|uniref:Dual specificity protein phosphatase 15 n=1 Tax=Merluccius polli TaxID=89951 RepID=A0AA47M7Q8_MERPO|nr:Dual specificity protein phosphatase 22-A [Merluccius polli]